MGNLNILHANSNTLVRAGLKSLLLEYKGINKLFEAKNKQELFDILKSKRAELLIIDYNQLGHFSSEDAKQVRLQYPNTKILIISTSLNPSYVISVLELGVHGYITYQCGANELINAVLAIVKGDKFYCTKIINIIFEKKFTSSESENCIPNNLSEREIEITKLISHGMTSKEVAAKLFLSYHTINTHRKNIFKKLGINSTSGMVLYAVNAGLINCNKNSLQ